MRQVRWIALICVVVGALLLSGCGTFGFSVRPSSPRGPSSSPAPAPAPAARMLDKGETGLVTGTLVKSRNEYNLREAATGVVYRFVGLNKGDQARLEPYVGKTIRIRLTVRSVESAKARNADFRAIVP